MTENEGFDMEEETVEDSSSSIAFDAGDEPASGSKPEARMILLLLLLLVVVAVGGYFYFGGLSVPQPLPPKVVKTPTIAVPANPQEAPLVAATAPSAATPPAPATQPEPPAAAAVPSAVKTPPSVPVAPKASTVPKTVPSAKTVAAAKPASHAEPSVLPSKTVASPYIIEAGAFLLPGHLETAERNVRKLGFKPRVTVAHRLVKVTRLLVGSYPPVEAKARVTDLEKGAAPGAFAIPRQKLWTVYADSFVSARNAVQFAKELQKKGIATRSEDASVKMPLSLLSFGTFANRDQARKIAAKARALHLDVLVVRRH